MFLLVCLLVFVGIFAAAMLLERLWLKPEKQSPARRTFPQAVPAHRSY